MSSLLQVVPLSQSLLGDILRDGDLAVDLTAGNGHDTLFLSRCVGPTGRVISFDLQRAAIDKTVHRLDDAGIEPVHIGPPVPAVWHNVLLINDGHERIGEYVDTSVKAAIANLGYLPGSDKKLITRPETTLKALNGIAERLAPGGRLAVVVYTGHAGGEVEAAAVAGWFAALDSLAWDVLHIDIHNRPQSPFLLVAEKTQPKNNIASRPDMSKI
ncbi:MAG: methyltransferase [Desulfuromonas sp.]|nr:MAG: methyltransferase [Desulfuromonas sp.]